jgi:hypothetical protein
LALIWLGVMLLPTILAEDAPHMLRASGALPVLFLFPALSLDKLWRWVDERGSRALAAGLTALIVGYGAWHGIAAYADHLHSETVYYQFESGATEMAVEINRFLRSGWQGQGVAVAPSEPAPERRVYMAPRLWRDWASVRYLRPPSEQLAIVGAEPVETAPEGDVMLVLWPFEEYDPALELLPRNSLVWAQEGAKERGDLEAESRLLYATIEGRRDWDAPQSADLAWEQGILLTGYDVIEGGDNELVVDLYWRAEGAVERDYTAFVHLLRDGVPIAQDDRPAGSRYYPSRRWRQGDTVLDRRVLGLPKALDPARDQLVVGLYFWQTMEHLRVLDDAGLPSELTTAPLPWPEEPE